MIVTTEDEVVQWFKDSPAEISFDSGRLHFRDAGSTCLQFAASATAADALRYGRAVALLGAADEEQFSGATVWLVSTDNRTPIYDRVGWALVEAIRARHGDLRSIEAAPAHFFRSDEFIDLQAVLFCCFAFGWDAYVRPYTSSRFFLRLRDAYSIIVAAEESAASSIISDLSRFGIATTLPPADRTALYCAT